jgi:autotransporter-associated beta strand protein
MLPTRSLRTRIAVIAVAIGVVQFAQTASAQLATGWKGTTSSDFQTSSNWDSGFGSNANLFVGNAWNTAGRGGSTTLNNASAYSGYRVTFENLTNNQTFTIQGSQITLFDFGGNDPKLENDSGIIQNFNAPLVLNGQNGGNKGEINPVNGDLSIGSTVDLAQTTQLQVFGNNGKTVTFNGAISSSGNSGNNKVVLEQNSTAIFKGANTYAGETDILAGTIRVDTATTGTGTNGTFFVGNGGATTTAATLLLGGGAAGTSGGVTLTNALTENAGSSGNRTIGGSNTTGTNTYSGTLSLTDSNTTLVAATGGTVNFNRITAGSAQTVAVGGNSNNGTVVLNGTLDNTNLAATVNSGTLVLGKTSSSSVHALGGNLTVNSGGTAQLGGSGGDQIFDSASVTVNSGGTFDLGGQSETISSFSLNGTGTSTNGALTNSSATASTLTVASSSSLAGATSIGSNNGNIVLAGAGNLTASSVTTLTKIGSDTLTLSNGASVDNTNIHLTVNAGTVVLNKSGSTVNGASGIHAAGQVTVNSGGTVQLSGTGGGQIFDGQNSVVNSGGVFDLNGQNQTFDVVNSNQGNLTINGTGISSGGALINSNTSTASTLTGPVALGSNSSVGGAGNFTINGVVSDGGSAFSLTKVGNGKVLLGGANTYTGGTTITAGTLQIGAGSTTGSLSTSSAITDNGTLAFNRSNNITQGVDFSGSAITGTGGLTEFGSGVGATLFLNATNTYMGNTSVLAGAISVSSIGDSGVAGNLGAGTTINLGSIGTTGRLIYTGTGENTSKVINLTGEIGNALIDQSGTGLLKFTSNVTTNGNGKTFILQGSTAGTGEIAGSIPDAAGVISLEKDGTGTWTLSGNNAYSGGTVVNAGILNGSANGAFGTGSVTANSGGTLMISNSAASDRIGNTAAVILNSGTFARSGAGTVSEGSGAHTTNGGVSSTGTNAVGMGALTLQANSNLDFRTDGIGTLTFASFVPNGHVLDILNYISIASGLNTNISGTDGTDDRLIFNQDESGALSDFSFNGISATEIALGGGFFEIVPVTPIPEPGTWAAAVLSAAIIIFGFVRHLPRRR